MSELNHKDSAAMEAAFKSGDVFTSTPEERERFIRVLCHFNVNGDESFRSRAVIRALTLNHLQMADTIRNLEATITKLNTENGRLSFRVAVFTLVATGATIIQAVIAYTLFARGG